MLIVSFSWKRATLNLLVIQQWRAKCRKAWDELVYISKWKQLGISRDKDGQKE